MNRRKAIWEAFVSAMLGREGSKGLPSHNPGWRHKPNKPGKRTWVKRTELPEVNMLIPFRARLHDGRKMWLMTRDGETYERITRRGDSLTFVYPRHLVSFQESDIAAVI
jgi:hypothetical protein